MLVDDDEDDGFFFEAALSEMDVTVELTFEQDAQGVLERFEGKRGCTRYPFLRLEYAKDNWQTISSSF